jgi:hypothetical protein
LPAFYPLLTLISVVVFVWLGRRMAMTRNRNRLGWAIAGGLLPPALIVLLMQKPRTKAELAADAAEVE